MKIEAYIICWNEARILPWVLDYWHAAGIDKLIVYDNRSDDDTLRLLSEYPMCIEVRQYDSGDRANDWIYRDIKCNCWKDSDADWVFVGDTDEVLFTPRRIKDYLKDVESPVLQPCLYQLVSWTLPTYDKSRGLLHGYPGVRLQRLGPNKVNLFQPSKVSDLQYSLGAHTCSPMYNGQPVPIDYRKDLSWFHLKNLGVEYLLQRNAQLYHRLPQQVRDEGRIATHYLPGTDVHNVASDLADMWDYARLSIDYPDLS